MENGEVCHNFRKSFVIYRRWSNIASKLDLSVVVALVTGVSNVNYPWFLTTCAQ